MSDIRVKATAERLLRSPEREMCTLLRRRLKVRSIQAFRGGRHTFLCEVHDCLSDRLMERLTSAECISVLAAIEAVSEVRAPRIDGSSIRRKAAIAGDLVSCGAVSAL